MARKYTPSFVLTIEMALANQTARTIEKDLEISRIIYNSCLGELLKREKQMKRTKKYKKLRRCLRAVSKNQSYYEKQENEAKIEFYKNEKKNILSKVFEMQRQYGLSEYSMHEYMKPIRGHFGNTLNAAIAQKVATRAWNTFLKKLKGESKKIKFIKCGEMSSFEGKSNNSGWMYKNKQIIFGKNEIDLLIKEHDVYMQEAISNIEKEITFEYKTVKGEMETDHYKVKYVRILKREIRGKTRYFAQLIVQGYPPPKRNKVGNFKHPIGKGRVGGDLGMSSIAVVGEQDILLTNLADDVEDITREIRLLQRKMDRSKRATNPHHFNENGTMKRGKKTWAFSNRYVKSKAILKELHRKQAAIRKKSHNKLANILLKFGDEHYWEQMNIKGLQRRAKKTELSEKTGKHKRKKRFGKSIGNRAPAMFLNILEHKVIANGGTFKRVNTWTFKASQYDHVVNDHKKKELKDRWHVFSDETRVQRDLYSAFLLKNSNKTGTKANRKRCFETYVVFKQFHDEEIKRIERHAIMVINSGLRLKI